MSKVIFITGAGRGLGADIGRTALAAGHHVVATGRHPESVITALGGEQDNLLVTPLDITDLDNAHAAVAAAVERFGRIDVLVNNAANFYAGYFEEISPEQMRRQIETNLFGPMNVTRAVLPTMRAQRAGHVLTISSLAGLIGQEFCVAYAAAKFGSRAGWNRFASTSSRSASTTTVVEPGFFRTELLVDASTTWAELSIADYATRTAETKSAWQSMNGQQPGDPAKLADALMQLIAQDQPPVRFVAGSDAIAAVEKKAEDLLGQATASRALGQDLVFDGVLSG